MICWDADISRRFCRAVTDNDIIFVVFCVGGDDVIDVLQMSQRALQAGQDVSSLLHFVHAVGSDIQEALHRSAPARKSVDHRKYIQRHLRHLTQASHMTSADTASPEATDANCETSFVNCEANYEAENCEARIDPQTTMDCKARIMSLQATDCEARVCGASAYCEAWFSKCINSDIRQNCETKCCKAQVKCEAKNCEAKNCEASKPVPLRQRQLPASFWQEPNQPRSVPAVYAGYPGLPEVPTLDPAACPLYLHNTLGQNYMAYKMDYPCLPYQPRTAWQQAPWQQAPWQQAPWEKAPWQSSRPAVWRPIPTKSLHSQHRYHPFTDVR